MLVELKSASFSAVVPNINEMPAMKLMSIQLVQDPVFQYGMILNLLRDNISEELHEQFDELSNIEMQDILAQWLLKAQW